MHVLVQGGVHLGDHHLPQVVNTHGKGDKRKNSCRKLTQRFSHGYVPFLCILRARGFLSPLSIYKRVNRPCPQPSVTRCSLLRGRSGFMSELVSFICRSDNRHSKRRLPDNTWQRRGGWARPWADHSGRPLRSRSWRGHSR